ncbi:M56 family metallopeptidase [Pantanalinema rosaneae CENA516]|uniref:M56 family metallopeptidase n=1 Tax=Pantanalinema rosaneae TaxID=1620701 RepID=UPI003D6FBD8E
MMHLAMILIGLLVAWAVRCQWFRASGDWSQRWQQALAYFLFPPVLLLTTAIAVLAMGPQGQMVYWWEGWLSYGLVCGFLIMALLLLLGLAWQAWRSIQQVRTYTKIDVKGKPSRLLNSAYPFVAQVGFWRPELVVSQGLLQLLTHDHLEAVLVHEQAHFHYRDTFWFFGLGWLRRLTSWLPQTDALWQELLLLRELRADRWAAQQVDSLLLAEALLTVVSTPTIQPELAAAFGDLALRDRLTERIDALLTEAPNADSTNWWAWAWLGMTLLPLVIIPFHS